MLSLLEALTLTPMRCSQFLHVSHDGKLSKFVDGIMNWMGRGYSRILVVLLRHRWLTVLGALAFFFASLLTAKHLPSELVPPQDQARFLIRIKAPVGSSLALTDGKLMEMQAILNKIPEVSGIFRLHR